MNEKEKEFIDSVPESDPGYAVKRLQIKEWYKPFGGKVLTSADLFYVAEKLNNFSDEKYWMKREDGDPILNRASVLKELLGMKKTDGEDLLDDYDRYQVACWLCSEEIIRGTFPSLGKYKGDNESEGEFVIDTLSDYSRLVEFWSHYIHIIDKNGELISGTDKEILNNFKELIAKHNKNYHKNLDYRSQVDLWEYGFEYTKEEGCIEALEFFFNKLREKKEKNELDQILIKTALYATSSNSFSLRHSNVNVIDFCLANLSVDNYKVLLQKNFEIHDCYSILDRLEDGYLFGYVKKLIDCLGPGSVSYGEFVSHLVCGMGCRISASPNRELMKMGGNFLIFIWNHEGFAEHRKFCLNDLSRGKSGLTDMLLDLAIVAAFEPLEEILNSASEMGRKKIAESFRNSSRACCALYIQDKKDLLSKVLDDTEYSSNFMRAIEEVLEHNFSYKEKWNEAFELHKEFRIRESMIKISELLSEDGLRDAVENKINGFEQCDQPKLRTRSKSCSDVATSVKKTGFTPVKTSDDCILPFLSDKRYPVPKYRPGVVKAYGGCVPSSLRGMIHPAKKGGPEVTSGTVGDCIPSSLSNIQSSGSIGKKVSK